MISTRIVPFLEQVPDAAASAWPQIIAGGSAAALVAWLFVFVLNRTTASHEKCTAAFAEAVKDGNEKLVTATEKFAQSVADQSKACGETTATLLREARQSSEQREARLIEVLKEVRKS